MLGCRRHRRSGLAAMAALDPIRGKAPGGAVGTRVGGGAGRPRGAGAAEGELPPARARGRGSSIAPVGGAPVGRPDRAPGGRRRRRRTSRHRRRSVRSGRIRRATTTGCPRPTSSPVAARIVREVGALWRGARRSDKRLATLSIDTVIRFTSPADRAAFTDDLARARHDARRPRTTMTRAPRGRPHRLIVAPYPAPDERRRLKRRSSCRSRRMATGKRWIEMEFVVPGTPEQVWQAVATGPGNTAWFTRATDRGARGRARSGSTSAPMRSCQRVK